MQAKAGRLVLGRYESGICGRVIVSLVAGEVEGALRESGRKGQSGGGERGERGGSKTRWRCAP